MDQVVDGVLSVDKGFLRGERDQYYNDFTIAFWRELFQNSVDAGAGTIRIDIEEKQPRRYGGPDAPEKVTNVCFWDDGHGMTAEVLNDVYFKMGRSTKKDDGGSIGGFGRARIMTCFSQESYSILTRDRFVSGDGPTFKHGSIAQQVAALRARRDEMQHAEGLAAKIELDGIESDLSLLTGPLTRSLEWTDGSGFAGCRVEVDIDPTPPKSYYARSGSIENMRKALQEYLSESQLPCAVIINGQTPEAFFGITDGKLQARKGPVRRVLSVDGPDGKVDFATVHTSEGKKAGFKGSLVVRVSGASMYRKEIDGLEAQVILEIDPTQSRNALNANRDGLKRDFNRAVDKLITDLTLDTDTALKDKSSKREEVKGERGSIRSSAPDLSAPLAKELSFDDRAHLVDRMAKAPRITSHEALHNIGLNQDMLEKLLEKTYYGDGFFYRYMADNYHKEDDLHVQLMKLRDGLYEARRDVTWFFESAGDLARNWVLAGLSMRFEEERLQRQKEMDARIEGVHDIYISMESTNAKTKAAARRHHPKNWDVTTGGGKAMRSLLAVWTAACKVSMESLFALRPAMSDVNWSTGFIYSLPEAVHQGDKSRRVSTGAQCVTLDNGDLRLLINPVNEDGTLRFSLSNERDLRQILAMSQHEIGHVLETYHNETLANLITALAGEVDHKVAFKRMKAELAAVTAAYAEGRARVHSLDREPGPRPAERLLAGAFGNDREAARDALTYDGAGVYSVDTDAAYAQRVEPEEENNNDNTLRYSVG
ncbi:ATP-binding protein [Agrobacterium salinitolerans]|nr:ATP-binding protein [Agrobacterium salinitolerans]